MSEAQAAQRKAGAVYVITKHGLTLGKKLKEALPELDLYVSAKILGQETTAPTVAHIPCALPLTPLLAAEFTRYEAHIFIISVGAVVRMVAPFIKDKKVDPAVVCVDDTARFAVALLSGHVGRGNEWTSRVASILGAEPVITTASDVQGTLTVDILGRAQGWVLDDHERLVTQACAAVVNERPVLIVQECGEPDFWPLTRPWPPGVHYQRELAGVDPKAWEMLLICSDRDIARLYPEAWERAIVYRPKSLVLGIGCDRDTPFELLERGVLSLLEEFQLSWKSVAGVASIDLKADEPALLALAAKYGWPLHFYGADELDATPGISRPSTMVQSHTGTRSVAEAACLLASGAAELLVPKQKYKEAGIPRAMTFAVARRPFAARS